MRHKNHEAEERHEANKRGVTRSHWSFMLTLLSSYPPSHWKLQALRAWHPRHLLPRVVQPVPRHSLPEATQIRHLPCVRHAINDSGLLPHNIFALSKKSNGAMRDATTAHRYLFHPSSQPSHECSSARRPEEMRSHALVQ